MFHRKSTAPAELNPVIDEFNDFLLFLDANAKTYETQLRLYFFRNDLLVVGNTYLRSYKRAQDREQQEVILKQLKEFVAFLKKLQLKPQHIDEASLNMLCTQYIKMAKPLAKSAEQRFKLHKAMTPVATVLITAAALATICTCLVLSVALFPLGTPASMLMIGAALATALLAGIAFEAVNLIYQNKSNQYYNQQPFPLTTGIKDSIQKLHKEGFFKNAKHKPELETKKDTKQARQQHQ